MRIELTIGIGEDAAGIALTMDEKRDARQHVLAQSANLFGGATVTQGTGVWVNPLTGKLIEEPTLTLTVYSPGDTDEEQDKAHQLAEIAREAFRQQSVVLAILPYVVPHFITGNEAIPVG